jgi:lysophospholipase L1-like esterase
MMEMAAGEIKIVCFGDSVTQGTPHVPEADTFPALLQRRLDFMQGDAGWRVEVINSGVGGENTAEGLARFDSSVAAHGPRVVSIEFGLNDIRPEPEKLIGRDDFAANLHEIVRRCRDLGAEVALMTPNPIIDSLHGSRGTELYAEYGGCNGAVSAYAEVVRTVADEAAAALCDIYARFVNIAVEKQFNGECCDYRDLTCLSGYISSADGVHPTIAGQEVIASELYKTMILGELIM